MLKNDGSYEGDIQQRCAKADSAFNSLTTVACDRPPSPTKSSCESTSPRFPYQYIRIEDSTIARLLLPAGVHKEELYDPRWKSLPDPKRKFWTDVVKEDLRTLGSSFETRVMEAVGVNKNEDVEGLDQENWIAIVTRMAALDSGFG
ncbi:hypothetical protein RB195_024374 [Necator americanus]|uniref:Uncharacterized protein n=1 Tax=Necator americanus TaxID=51031 RepID=A0ABR1EMW9_NECAM